MTVEVPFLLAAAVLPFTVEDGVVLGVTVGAKITIGVLAMVILSSTTPFRACCAASSSCGRRGRSW
jgi:energy-coupling factor transporter transmembrane protein EcfT